MPQTTASEGRPQPFEELARLDLDAGDERRILAGVVHVREHEVLPDEEPELVGEIVEVVRFVRHRSADAQHVHAAVTNLQKGRFAGRARRDESDGIDGRPARPPAEERHVVDAQRELAGLCNLAKPNRPEVNRNGGAVPVHQEMEPVERRLSVRVRPPQIHARNVHESREPPARGRGEGDSMRDACALKSCLDAERRSIPKPTDCTGHV